MSNRFLQLYNQNQNVFIIRPRVHQSYRVQAQNPIITNSQEIFYLQHNSTMCQKLKLNKTQGPIVQSTQNNSEPQIDDVDQFINGPQGQTGLRILTSKNFKPSSDRLTQQSVRWAFRTNTNNRGYDDLKLGQKLGLTIQQWKSFETGGLKQLIDETPIEYLQIIRDTIDKDYEFRNLCVEKYTKDLENIKQFAGVGVLLYYIECKFHNKHPDAQRDSEIICQYMNEMYTNHLKFE